VFSKHDQLPTIARVLNNIIAMTFSLCRRNYTTIELSGNYFCRCFPHFNFLLLLRLVIKRGLVLDRRFCLLPQIFYREFLALVMRCSCLFAYQPPTPRTPFAPNSTESTNPTQPKLHSIAPTPFVQNYPLTTPPLFAPIPHIQLRPSPCFHF